MGGGRGGELRGGACREMAPYVCITSTIIFYLSLTIELSVLNSF